MNLKVFFNDLSKTQLQLNASCTPAKISLYLEIQLVILFLQCYFFFYFKLESFQVRVNENVICIICYPTRKRCRVKQMH